MTAKIKLNATSGGGSVSLKAPSSTTNDDAVELQLPVDNGNNGQALVTDGSGNLSFDNITSGTSRNLIINGAMQVAQRGESSSSSGYKTVDRFYVEFGGNSGTQSRSDVASGTTPYTLGFRKALKLTNSSQSAGSGDLTIINYTIEAQDIANSGWNYLDSNSKITLSFWVKSSVPQNFYGRLYSYDGTAQGYSFETGSLSQDTWTKITKTIPGNSNLQFDNNQHAGLLLEIAAFRGTNFTASDVVLNQWAAYSAGHRMPDFTSTWYTTNAATFEITGVQLEKGDIATDFPHRSFAQELVLCTRYYQTQPSGESLQYVGSGNVAGRKFPVMFPTMRVAPTVTFPYTDLDGGGTFAAGQETVRSFNTYAPNSGRFYSWRHNLDAEL